MHQLEVASASQQLPRSVVLRPVDDLDLTLETFVMWRRDRLGATGRAFVGAVRDYITTEPRAAPKRDGHVAEHAPTPQAAEELSSW